MGITPLIWELKQREGRGHGVVKVQNPGVNADFCLKCGYSRVWDTFPV